MKPQPTKNYRQEYADFNNNKSNVGLKAQPTLISVSSRRWSIVVSCLRHHSSRKVAFTLAEVLITLGIIGVVAAMTLPTLIANGRKTETISRLKKFNSTMQQALLMAQKDYGEPKYWTKPLFNFSQDEDGNPVYDENGNIQYDKDAGAKDTIAFLNTYILPYIKYAKVVEKDPNFLDYVALYFNDGSVAAIANGACLDVHYDTNGKNNPNIRAIDRFYFMLCLPPYNLQYLGKTNQYWGTYLIPVASRNNRTQALNLCKTSPVTCTRLIELDGWKFKDDYPYKL